MIPASFASSQSLAVIIVTHNSGDAVGGLLDSLAQGLEGVGRTRVLVVDNDSRDDTCAIARAHSLPVEVIETGRNAGYAAGINIGYRAIDPADHVLVLNADLRLGHGAAATLVDRLADPGTGIVAPRLIEPDGRLAHSVRREPSVLTAWSEAVLGGHLAARLGIGEVVSHPAIYYRCGGSVAWATGAALLIGSAARQAIGDWDEDYFLYSEETDYMRRARAKGLKVIYEPRASAVHVGGESGTSAYLHAVLTANRIRYFQTYHGAMSAALFRTGVMLGEAIRLPRGGIYPAGLRAAFAAG